MASLWKDNRTQYHVACFTVYSGQEQKQCKRSTYTTDRRLAQRIAAEIEDAAQGRRSTHAVMLFLESIEDTRIRQGLQKVFNDVMRMATGAGIHGKSARAFVERWIERVRSEVSSATFAKYQHTAGLFLASLGPKADQPLTSIHADDVARFRDEQGRRVSASSANLMLKIVRVILGAAEVDGLVMKNEARLVKRLKSKGDEIKRRAFTLPELNRLLKVCDSEWYSMVLFGFYTGARLGDLARLTWQQINTATGEVIYVSQKTRRTVVVPMADPLQAHVAGLEAGDDPKQPVHPRAYETVIREGRSGTLSRQFGELLAEAGLVAAETHHAAKEGKGRSARRQVSEISFHALRHTAVSLLKSAGVSDAVARDLAGHESAEVSRLYTHIEDSAKRAAVNRLPDLGGETARRERPPKGQD